MGAKQSSKIVNYNEWYRLFTPMVLHAGIIHYFLNMLALWFIGSAVGRSHGFIAAAVIFVIPTIGKRPKRDKLNDGSDGFRDLVMPSWTPPGVVFPIMWVLII